MDPITTNKLGGATFICTECGQGFSLYSNLLNHLVIHGPLDSFSLDGSSNGFDVAREYMLHENGTLTVVERSDSVVKAPTPPKPLPPHPVHQPTSKFKSIEASVKGQTPTPANYRCETCNKSFNSLRNLQKHQQYRKTEDGHKCTLCCKVFSDKEELKGHLQEHAHERFYCCGHCGKRFLKLETLYAHQKEHHQSSGIRSVKKSDSEQENNIEKTYPCKKCRLHFFWLSDLQSHLLSHSKGKDDTEPPTPEIKAQPLLNENSHNSYDNTDNDENDLSFNMKIDHSIDHSNAFTGIATQSSFRPYRCGLCGDRFQQLADLKKHHYSHQTQTDIDQTLPKRKKPTSTPEKRGRPRRRVGPKLHPCKFCHRAFNHSSSLSRHMRYHKGTLHTCVFCGRHFPQRCDVRRHIAMYHKKELEKKPGLRYKALHTKPEIGPEIFPESESSGRRRRKSKEYTVVAEIEDENEQTTRKRSKAPKPRVNYKCQECGKRFGLLCVYQRHLRYHKRQPGGELLKCPRCPSRFQQSSALKLHLNNHPDQFDGEVDMEGQTSPIGSNQAIEHGNGKEVLEVEEDIGHPVGDQEASGKVLYECTECTENFSCLQKFLQHQTSHGSDSFE